MVSDEVLYNMSAGNIWWIIDVGLMQSHQIRHKREAVSRRCSWMPTAELNLFHTINGVQIVFKSKWINNCDKLWPISKGIDTGKLLESLMKSNREHTICRAFAPVLLNPCN